MKKAPRAANREARKESTVSPNNNPALAHRQASNVSAPRRWTHDQPCLVCGGHQHQPRGAGQRCHGYVGTEGWAHCTREPSPRESAGSGTYAHRAEGACPCRREHAPESSALRSAAPSAPKAPWVQMVEPLGPPTDSQVRALIRDRRLIDARSLAGLGVQRVRVTFRSGHTDVCFGFQSIGGQSWKLWNISAHGEIRRGAFGWCGSWRLNAGPSDLIVSPQLRTNPPTNRWVWDVAGESDLLAAVEHGLECVLTETTGEKSLSAHMLRERWLLELEPLQVIVVRDLDEDGKKGAQRARKWWLERGVAVRVLELPESLGKGGDLRDFLMGTEVAP